MKKYKIIICNLGYENAFLCSLNNKEFYNSENALEEILTELPNGFDTKEIDGFQVKKIHDDINFNEEGISPVVETEIPDRWIYIREI